MFYKAGDPRADGKSPGRLNVYRETNVKDIEDVREELSNEKLNIVPFVPNPPLSWRYDESFAHGTGSPWVTGYQRQSRSREPHAAALLEPTTKKVYRIMI